MTVSASHSVKLRCWKCSLVHKNAGEKNIDGLHSVGLENPACIGEG